LTKIEVEHSYRFDSAYDETVSNEELYEDAIRPLIYHFFQGAKVSCFAYGQTGKKGGVDKLIKKVLERHTP